MNCIETQFVKFNENEVLPEVVRGKYFFNYTLSGIEVEGYGIPAIYVNLLFAGDPFTEFLKVLNENPAVVFEGIEGFRPGSEYWLNDAVVIESEEYPETYDIDDYEDSELDAEYNDPEVNVESLPLFSETPINVSEAPSEDTPEEPVDEPVEINVLPVYWVNGARNEEFFDTTVDLEFIMKQLIKRNIVHDYSFSEEELRNFYKTFCSIIKLYSEHDILTQNNQIYDKVLDYYMNGQTDSAAVNIALILNSLYTVKTNNTSCGCTNNMVTGGNNDGLCATSCFDFYKQGMANYLKQMLGDINFYKDWFFVTVNGDIEYKEPNDEMIDLLELLIDEFVSLGYDLSFGATSKGDCNCPVIDNSVSECNYKIIANYRNILEWVRNNQIDENTNKIKIYGEAFGEILPKMQF